MADVSKFNVDGTEVNVKDASARQGLQTQGQNIQNLTSSVNNLNSKIVDAVKAEYSESTETISLTKISL